MYRELQQLYADRLQSMTDAEYALLKSDMVLHGSPNYEQYANYAKKNNITYRRLHAFNPQTHKGQRKLLLTEVQFLTRAGATKPGQKILLYVGAADGQHLRALSTMFPGFIMILYDRSPFHPEVVARGVRCETEDDVFLYTDHSTKDPWSDPGVQANSDPLYLIFNKFFDDQIAEFYAKHFPDLFFISDIRIAPDIPSVDKMVENVTVDMQTQYNWTRIMKPAHTLLKFRLPYIEPGPDGKRVDIQVPYFRGEIWLQPWAPVHSTETRLYVTRKDLESSNSLYSSIDYESAMYAFNLCRPAPFIRDPDFVIRSLDLFLENNILNEYISVKFGRLSNVDRADALDTFKKLINKHVPFNFFRDCQKKIAEFKSGVEH